jgi:hypothetical protein
LIGLALALDSDLNLVSKIPIPDFGFHDLQLVDRENVLYFSNQIKPDSQLSRITYFNFKTKARREIRFINELFPFRGSVQHIEGVGYFISATRDLVGNVFGFFTDEKGSLLRKINLLAPRMVIAAKLRDMTSFLSHNSGAENDAPPDAENPKFSGE